MAPERPPTYGKLGAQCEFWRVEAPCEIRANTEYNYILEYQVKISVIGSPSRQGTTGRTTLRPWGHVSGTSLCIFPCTRTCVLGKKLPYQVELRTTVREIRQHMLTYTWYE